MGLTDMAITNPFKGLPKPELYAVLVGGAAVTGYVLYRHHKNTGSWSPFATGTSGSASSGTTADGTSTTIDPVTGLAYADDNATDPLTGLQYLQEAQQYGSVQAAESVVSDYGSSVASGSGYPVAPAIQEPNGTLSGSTNPPGSPYNSNAGWAQAAQAGLVDVGYDATTVGAALGAYLTGTPLTADQAKIVNTAIAEFGKPPVGDLQVILAPVSQPGPAMVTVPNVVGKTLDEADTIIRAAGLVPASSGTGTVSEQSPAAGTQVTKNSKVTLTLKATPAKPPVSLKPVGVSATGYKGYADIGWETATGAGAYQYQISGPEPKTGITTKTSLEKLKLKPGKYEVKVRAGLSTTDIHGPWSTIKPFTVS